MDETEKIDTAASRYKMFAVTPGMDADKETAKARKQALLDSIGLGMDADQVLDVQTKAIRDGISPEIAKTLPKSLAAAAQVMGGDVEKLTDSLAEGIQQSFSMGWIKDAQGARKLLNIEAGLSNFQGNTAQKTEDFIKNGGLGFGKEGGYNALDTLAMGAILNSSGEGNGRSSARFLGQLSQNVPKMVDKYREARDSHKNTEEGRAVRSAPYRLGYGSIMEMQRQIMAGPEGLIDFAQRLQERLDDKNRKLVLEGYGFSQQGGAALAEIGANPSKAKSIIARTKELSEQKEANDYLTEKFKEWQTGLVAMIKQIEAGWHAIESELGDVIKNDIIAPIRDWWSIISTNIINSPMKDNFHKAITGFINGLGFNDLRELLESMTAGVHGFDIAGFSKGLGEGIRTTVDAIKGLFATVASWSGSGDAETLGKISSELFGLALAAHAIGPVIGIVGSISAGILALSESIKILQGAMKLTGLLGGSAGLAEGGLAAGAITSLPITIAAIAAGVTISAIIINWDAIINYFSSLFGHNSGSRREEILKNIPPAFRDDASAYQKYLTPAQRAELMQGPDRPNKNAWTNDPIEYRKQLWHRSSSDDGDYRQYIQKASYNDGSADRVKDAIIGTEQAVKDLRDQMVANSATAQLAALTAANTISDSIGGGGGGYGGAAGSGMPSIRYGRGSNGGYRTGPMGKGTASQAGSGGSRSWRNNNPGNIEYGPYARRMGATGSDGRFAIFPSYQAGRHAQEHLLFESGAYKDLTLSQAIGKWAPGSENNVPAYLSAMTAAGGGINAGMHMSQFSPAQRSALLDAMQRHEGWRVGSAGSPGGSDGNGTGIDIAERLIGANGSQAANALKSKMTPGQWCADFVNGVLKASGGKGINSSLASDFAQWGNEVSKKQIKRGDVMVENHHVGMATGEIDPKTGRIGMVSGNYGNQVGHSWEDPSKVLSVRRAAEIVSKMPKDAAGIAREVPSDGRSKGLDNGDSGDISMTNHFHVNSHDPRGSADEISRHMEKLLDRSHDVYSEL